MNLFWRSISPPSQGQSTPYGWLKPLGLVAVLVVLLGAWAAWWAVRQADPLPLPPGEISTLRPLEASHQRVSPLPASQPAAGGALPQAELAEAFNNFGRISSDEPVSHDFYLANAGSTDLEILRAYTTCACTSAHISSALIPPGEAARITVTFDPRVHDVSGTTVRRGLILETNDPNSPLQEIWVQAMVD